MFLKYSLISIFHMALLILVVPNQASAQTSIATEGVIESKSGGFKFPDGTVQLSADRPVGASRCSLPDEYVVGFDPNGQIVCRSLYYSEKESTFIDSLPFSTSDDTSLSTEDEFVYYSCARSVLNKAPEIIYELSTAAYGSLTIDVDDGAGIDHNIYLLSSPDANNCVASSSGSSLTYNVNAGERYWIAVDPFCNSSGECLSGAFDLHVDLAQLSVAQCGDGVVEGSEVCDDFNADACGTCSFDCSSSQIGGDCPVGSGCGSNDDCLSGLCELNVCAD
jgi:hypothetical protein